MLVFVWLLWLFWTVVAVVVARAILLYRTVPQRHAEDFEGVVYRVGRAAVAERASGAPRATVICMHGFCEDLRYFTRYYADPDIQLILLMSADYHVPIAAPRFRAAEWAAPPAVPEGSVEYDAAVLVQALQHLPRAATVRVHGHSRGGAVVLEAAAQRPDLFRDAEVVLEAPVLPRAEARQPFSRAGLWFFPFVAALWRLQPISRYNRHLWGSLENARKREIIAGYPFNARRTVTLVRNLESLGDWMSRRDHALYQNLHRGTVLIPGDDQVLDPVSMEASARHAEKRLDLVRLDGASHFVVFDRPDAIPPIGACGAGRAPARPEVGEPGEKS